MHSKYQNKDLGLPVAAEIYTSATVCHHFCDTDKNIGDSKIITIVLHALTRDRDSSPLSLWRAHLEHLSWFRTGLGLDSSQGIGLGPFEDARLA